MAENQENSQDTPESDPKAKLDDDDILEELGLTEKNAELNSEGSIDKEPTTDKAALDTEGIYAEEDLKTDEKQTADKKPDRPEDQTGAGEAQEEAKGPGKIQSLLLRLKDSPAVKISVIGYR